MTETKFELIESPLGVSARGSMYEEINKYPYEGTALVLPDLARMREARIKANCRVLSMDKLALKILNANGYAGLELIGRRSTGLIVEEVIGKLAAAGELEYFGRLAEKPGFLRSMANLIGQLARSGADKETLAIAFEAWESGAGEDEGYVPPAKEKNSDVLKIFCGYLDYLEEHKLFDVEGIYRIATKVLMGEGKPPFMPFKRVFICDFYSMNTLEIEFVTQLSRRCRVVLGMCYDKDRDNLFDGARETYGRLYWQDRKSGSSAPGFAKYEKQGLGEGREHLLRNWGRPCAERGCGWLEAFYAASKEEELRCVLGRIKKELAGGSCSCGDILIVAPDLEAYAGLRQIADEYGVPVRLPKTAPLVSQPVAELILLALKAAPDTAEGAKSYLALLGRGLLKFCDERDPEKPADPDWEKLADMGGERYISRRSVARARAREMIREAQAEGCDAGIDVKLLDAVDSFIAGLGSAETVRGLRAKTEALLGALDIERRLGRRCLEGRLGPDAVATAVRGRDKLLDTLLKLERDYAACAMADKPVALARLAGILEKALKDVRVAESPGRENGVAVTEIISAQGMDYKSVYMLGMSRDEFPEKFRENWIYSDAERNMLEMLGYCLPRAALTGDEYFFLSAALCAREKLTLFWHVEEGKRPEEDASPYAVDAMALFGVEPQDAAKDKEPCSFEELESEGFFTRALRWQGRDKETFAEALRVDRLRKSPGAQSGVFNGNLEGTDAAGLVRERLRKRAESEKTSAAAIFSASALERYIKCPFLYLGEKVWREEEFKEKDDRVEPVVEGLLLHDTLSYFVKGEHEYDDKEKAPARESYLGISLAGLDHEKTEKGLMEAFGEIARHYAKIGKLTRGVFWHGVEARLRRWLKRWLKDELAEAALMGSAPIPISISIEAAEIRFGPEKSASGDMRQVAVALSDGKEVLLEGRIDRIDRLGREGDGYLRVVDYKRGDTPTQTDVKGGKDLQLALYCMAASSGFEGKLKVEKGAYFSLKDCKRNEWVDFTNPKAKRAEFEEGHKKHIKESAEGILAGKFCFNVKDKKPDCGDNCPLMDFCRMRMLEPEGGLVNG